MKWIYKVLAIIATIGGVLGSIFFYVIGRKHGVKSGRKEVQKEHEVIIDKIEKRDETKQTVNQTNVAAKLNDRFGGTPK